MWDRSKFLSYNECKEWIKNNLSAKELNNWYDWNNLSNELPNFIPINPKTFYEGHGWISWDDFLGIESEIFLKYEEAKKWVHNNIDINKINTITKWRYNTWRLPNNIPKSPEKTYKFTGWVSWSDWLGQDKYEI